MYVENYPVIPAAAGSDIVAPIDGSESVDEIQLTDDQGYKVFGPFLYGRFIDLTPQGLMKTKYDSDWGQRNAADMAQSVQADPASLRYLISPNIGAIRLGIGGTVGSPGAGVNGERFRATSTTSDNASMPKRGEPVGLTVGRVSVDMVNNCEAGTVSVQAGADTPAGQQKIGNIMNCRRSGPPDDGSYNAILREIDAVKQVK
jgi:hypothetical protein